MYNDYIATPKCSEKSIIRLSYLVSVKLASEALLSDDTILVPDRIESEIEKEFKSVKQHLDVEDFQSTTIRDWVESSFADVKKEDWKRALTTLRKIYKHICPLDIQELVRLVEKVNTASESLRGKKVVLFLGETGSGKSTTIHFLAGSKMIETKMEGLTHIGPDLSSIKDSQLKDVTSTPFAESVTRYITPVTVNFEDVGSYSTGSIVLCDSPGFEDTGGPEVDIANGISIIRAIKTCKTVKPVILISYLSVGDRYVGLKKLARVLVGLIPGIKDHIQAFSYFFTKYPANKVSEIHASLDNVRKTMNDEDKSDTGLDSLFKDMLRKTKKDVIVIDPINGNSVDILDSLADSAAISHPDEVFEFYITEKSKGIVHEQVEKHKNSIMSAIKRSDYELVKYKLGHLNILNQFLEQDHIEQAYNECIRSVSRHLEKEYKDTTNMLKRCLENEQVLNDEVIKQLRTFIEHANQAEILRNIHLEKELVSSSAFFHYMIEQVDSFVDDLKQKSIDDISVTNDLNTLKLLSESFPESISSKYKDVQQAFIQKIESLADTFRQSFISRNFDESANEMTKLDKSQKILQNHINNTYIQNLYEQLKSEFLQYLKKYVGKLDYLFNQEKLDKDDVDRLNDCVYLLESVKNTFALHAHISLETINQIQEELLSKISSYFDEIIEKINTQLETVNPFDKLKSSMEELDSIRTITSIEVKTSQSYFKTLEKICGCIRESKRTIEDILKAFQRDERGIDYTKLMDHVFRLETVEWFRQYRPEVYSDAITNIEGQIIHHVEVLKRSLLGITLDLSNYSKLESVSKIVIEIDAMRPIDKIFKNIGQIIHEVNTWFEKTINTVFTVIKDTFNFDETRRKEEISFDTDKLDKAFNYLNVCKSFSMSLNIDWLSVLNNLQEFVRHYYHYVQEEMQNCFESIQQYPHETKEIVLKNARIFSNRLQEISELKKEHAIIFSCLPNQRVVDEWERKLKDYIVDLSDEMSRLQAIQQTHALTNKLFIAKALSACDSFLTGEKYIDLYRQYQTIFFTQNQDVCRTVIQAIKDNSYEQVASEIVALQASNEVGEHFYKQVKRALNFGLDNLITETKNQAITLRSEMEIEEIRPLVDNLKRMRRAKQFISAHLDESEQIDETIKEVEKMIEKKFERFLRSVGALIDTSNFYEADRKIVAITTARTLLGQHCTEHVCQLMEELRDKQNEAVSNLVKKYSKLDISDYTLNPPIDIFEKFAQVNATNTIYDQSLRQIQEEIFSKFREELNKATSRMPPDPDNPHIRKIESALRYLPETLKNALEPKLNQCKEDIQKIIQDHDNKLNNAVRTKDLTRIRSVLKEYSQSEDMQSFANKSQKVVFEQIQEMELEIKRNLAEYHIREALNIVKKLYESERVLGEFVVEIRTLCFEVGALLQKTFHEAYYFFMNYFFSTRTTSVTNEISAGMNRSFSCLIEFIKFRDELENTQNLPRMLPADFNEKTNIFIAKFVDHLSQLEKNSIRAMKETDMITLKHNLHFMCVWDSLLTYMRDYTSMLSNQGSSMKKITEAIGELTSYSELTRKISNFFEEQVADLQNENLISVETKEFSTRRDDYYRKLNEKLLIIANASVLTGYVTAVDRLYQDCLEILARKISKICSDLEEYIRKLSDRSTLTRQEYIDVSMYFSNLIAFKQEIKVKDNSRIYEDINKIEKRFFDIIEMWETSARQESTHEKICDVLIKVKRTANNILPFKTRINERIDEILNWLKLSKNDAKIFAKLGTLFNQDKTGVGQSIIAEHKAFQGFSLSLFNEKTKRHNIEYVLNYIEGNSIDKRLLKKRFDEFDGIYHDLIKHHLRPDLKLERLISDTVLLVGKKKQTVNDVQWDGGVREIVPKLMAHIFALWTLKHSEHYFEAKDLEDRDNYLLQPHAAQVISIFRMLGIGDEREELINNLVQIGTGEGKSVTLAVTAIVLALLGFDVNCACYSEYLSQRDYTAFLTLFDALGVTNHIHYGTFQKLCEDKINENGNIREVVENLISTDSNRSLITSQNEKRAKILLIDEVDVFFSREFYGSLYTPAASVRDSTITALTNYIWTNKKSGLNLNKMKNTNEYKVLCQKFPNWTELINEAIKDMLSDVGNFESHHYVVSQDKIGYIEQDDVVFDVVYGYKTLFAYYFEHEKGRISKESLEENVTLEIKCGSFSYAEIPLQFEHIMGVTGTLRTLSDPEKRVIESVYKIKKSTFSPSVFGKNNLKFTEKDDIMIEISEDYLNVIRREIDKRLRGNSGGKRAVLVFFDSEKKLKAFYDSPVLASIKESVCYLTEEATLEEKENLIKRATGSGQITLFTKVFGRGTDFVCYDETVASNDGVHVIQTFLSEELSEEVQIKGRTARQGNFGSYSMVLSYNDLEKFQITQEDIENVKKGSNVFVRAASTLRLTKTYSNVYDLLNEKRTDLFKMQYEANRKYVEEAKEKHKAADKFLLNLHSGNIDFVRNFLIQENKGAEGNHRSRTICLMDATGSMFYLLHSCKQTVGTMFQRTSQILKDNNIDSNSFQIQFAIYRNYNSQENDILQNSPWESKPDNLRTFMNNIESDGGYGNEAIEIGLWHANRENEREPITQVILIGDAPPNTKPEVESKRNIFGKRYWTKTKFAQPTYYKDELEKLKLNSIPVHTFYVDTRAEREFKSIASSTGGRSEMLDINSPAGEQKLTDLVTEEVLRNVGGALKGNALVQAYRSKFRNVRNNPDISPETQATTIKNASVETD